MADNYLTRFKNEGWVLVERYVKQFPFGWALVFARGDEVLEIMVSEDVWRAFDIQGG